ncbi:SPIRE2 isoform 6, partial [Pan troglodytes]
GLRGSPGRRLRDTGDLLLRGDGSVGAREPEAAVEEVRNPG